MLRVQCTWCGRFKAEDGRPVGSPAPLDVSGSHGICTECAERVKAALDGTVDCARTEASLAPHQSAGTHPVVMAPEGPFRDEAFLPTEPCHHREQPTPPRSAASAWIVVHPCLLELRADDKGVIRSIIYERASTASKERARALLVEEAAALGFVLAGEVSSGCRSWEETERRGNLRTERGEDPSARHSAHLMSVR
jgi:hypothetical protein